MTKRYLLPLILIILPLLVSRPSLAKPLCTQFLKISEVHRHNPAYAQITDTQLKEALRVLMVEQGLIQSRIQKMSKEDLAPYTEAFGFQLSGAAFIGRIVSRFGSSKLALEQMGISLPEKRVSWTPENKKLVLELLQEHFGPENLNYKFINSLSKSDLQFLVPHLKAEVSGPSIIRAFQQGGSLYEAFKKETQDVNITQASHRRGLSLLEIEEIIQKLSLKHSLASKKIQSLSKEEVFAVTGVRISGSALYNQVIKRHSTPWYEFLENMGIHTLNFRERHPSLSEKEIILVIQEIAKHQEDIHYAAINRLSERDLSYLTSQYKIKKSGSMIINDAILRFGSWDQAVAAAKLIRKNQVGEYILSHRKQTPPLNQEQLISAIQKINEMGFELNLNSVSKLSKEDLFFLTQSLNVKKSGAALIIDARKAFGSWDEAVIASDVLSKNIKGEYILSHRKRWIVFSKDELIYIIQELHKRINPSFNTVVELSKEDLAEITSNLNVLKSGAAILEDAVKSFGSWDQALVASGLNPDHIRQSGMAKYAVLTPAMQEQRKHLLRYALDANKDIAVEFTSSENKNIVLIDKITSEDILMRQELNASIHQAISVLSPREQLIFELLIEKMQEQRLHEDYSGFSIERLIQDVVNMNYEVKSAEIQNLFAKIAQNQELKEMLFDSKD